MKILHTSDLHLGRSFEHLGAFSEIRQADLINTFSNIVEIAILKKVHFVVIAGDLFDRPNVENKFLAIVKLNIQRLIKKGIQLILLPGNHDLFLDEHFYNSWLRNNIILLDKTTVLNTSEGKIAFYPYVSNGNYDFPFKSYDDNILLHFGVCHMELNEVREKIDKLTSFNFVFFGHLHNWKEIKVNSKIIGVYPGTPEGLNFKEEGQRFILFYNNGQMERLNIAKREIKIINIEVNEFKKNIIKVLKYNGLNKIIINGEVDGEFNPYDYINYIDENTYVKIVDNTKLKLNSEQLDQLGKQYTVLGEFLNIVKESIKNKTMANDIIREVIGKLNL